MTSRVGEANLTETRLECSASRDVGYAVLIPFRKGAEMALFRNTFRYTSIKDIRTDSSHALPPTDFPGHSTSQIYQPPHEKRSSPSVYMI